MKMVEERNVILQFLMEERAFEGIVVVSDDEDERKKFVKAFEKLGGNKDDVQCMGFHDYHHMKDSLRDVHEDGFTMRYYTLQLCPTKY